jgi:glucose uptake protein GlcU
VKKPDPNTTSLLNQAGWRNHAVKPANSSSATTRSLHGLGVACGFAAGAWLGGAEAPTKLVVAGISPFVISFCMVAGVFVARWTLPTILKGTGYVFQDLRERAHLIVWAIMAGALWAVANTLTVFAIRDVGLSIAFPLWNTNCLVGLLWGWLFFRELRGAGGRSWAKVLGGAVAIVVAAILLGLASSHQPSVAMHRSARGIVAALGASLLWGTMYIPYRKAYLSGMNPLSFVTIFTVGELGTMTALAVTFQGGPGPLLHDLGTVRAEIFWLFLGGFCWVVGDLYQQYATKYIGIGRAIPLSNTNQLWGLLWAVLVFGEFAGAKQSTQTMVVVGSIVMILGALSISSAVAPAEEQAFCREAIARECQRYGLSLEQAEAALLGKELGSSRGGDRRWWDILILAGAVAVFVWLACGVRRPPIAISATWTVLLTAVMVVVLFLCGWLLWKRTRFS